MKKIAIFSHDLSVGGIQKSLSNLLRNLDLTKYEVDLYLLDNNNFYEDKLPSKINVYYLPKHSKIYKYLPFSLLKLFAKYEGQNKEYDVAIDFDGYQMLTALNVYKSRAKKKVMWIHNNCLAKKKYEKKYRLANFLTKGKNKYFTEYVGVSLGVIEPFKQNNHLKDIKYHIIPNIIDSSEIFAKLKEKCDLKVDSNKYNFCSTGRLNIQKGYDILLNYLKDLTSYRQDFMFYLIGDGPEMANLKKQVQDLELTSYVTFLGYQKNPYKYMNLMDGFILTSRYEGQGMVLWEAKALSLELFMTKNLEQYNNDLKGYDNILDALKTASKKTKQYDDLKSYNASILKEIDKLLND